MLRDARAAAQRQGGAEAKRPAPVRAVRVVVVREGRLLAAVRKSVRRG